MLQNFSTNHRRRRRRKVKKRSEGEKTILPVFGERQFFCSYVMNATAPTLKAVMADPAAIRVPTKPTVAPVMKRPLSDKPSYFFRKNSSGPDSMPSSALTTLGKMQEVKTKQAKRLKIFLLVQADDGAVLENLMVKLGFLAVSSVTIFQRSSTQIVTRGARERRRSDSCGRAGAVFKL
jgi:hypothetical protein